MRALSYFLALTFLWLTVGGCGGPSRDDAEESSAAASTTSAAGTGVARWSVHRGDSALAGSVDVSFASQWSVDWTRLVAESPVTGLAVADDSIFACHADGTVARLPLSGGEPLWRRRLDAELDAPPTIADSKLFVGTLDGAMMALRLVDGSTAWTHQTEDAIHGGANVAKTPDGETLLVFGSYDTNLYAVNLADGQLVWRHGTKNYVHGTPAVLGTSIVATGCDGRVRRLNSADGGEVFSIAASSYIPGAPAVSDSLTLVTGHDGTTAAVDNSSGTLAWSMKQDPPNHTFVLSPAVNATQVVTASQNGKVFCRELADGALTWKVDLPSPSTAAPLMGRQTVLFGTQDGTLEQLALATGEAVSSTTVGAAISCDLAVTPHGILLGTEQGLLAHVIAANQRPKTNRGKKSPR